jgi:hypothetical protein
VRKLGPSATAKGRTRPPSGKPTKSRTIARDRSANRKPAKSGRPAAFQPKQPRPEVSEVTNERVVVEAVDEVGPGVLVVEEIELEAERDE